MTLTAPPQTVSAEEVADRWVTALDDAFARGDADAAAALVDADGYWKDVLALSWAYRSWEGREQIAQSLESSLPAVRPRAHRSTTRTAPRRVKRSGLRLIEAFFDLETAVGTATGFVRLHDEPETGRPASAWIVLTALQQLHGSEERLGVLRPDGEEYSHGGDGQNWLDLRQQERAYTDRDPQVLVVGAGQGGLMIGARLRHMGVDALLVDNHDRVGDNWRERYHSLLLHNETWGNSLPYLPFPDSWPTFLPKDKLAGWLEAYVEAMELNVWTGTTLLGAERDAADELWVARLRLPDGSERVLRTPHLVLATGGHSGVPYVPDLPGREEFAGEVLHSSGFTSGMPYAGKHAVVFGTGNSGHDIAQELHTSGAASVTMVQRSPTCVVSLRPSGVLVYAIYSEGVPAEDVDLITAAIPYPVLKDTYQHLTRRTCELDRELIDGLEAAGFRTDYEPDGTGFHMRYLRKGGGYYINVGASDMIIDGRIGVRQADDVQRLTSEGLLMSDGSVVRADLVVLATGYSNQQEGVRRLLGDEVAERVGPIWGFDDNQTMRNMWQRTAQKGLWVMGGALMEARFHSRPLALQIVADLTGTLPAAVLALPDIV